MRHIPIFRTCSIRSFITIDRTRGRRPPAAGRPLRPPPLEGAFVVRPRGSPRSDSADSADFADCADCVDYADCAGVRIADRRLSGRDDYNDCNMMRVADRRGSVVTIKTIVGRKRVGLIVPVIPVVAIITPLHLYFRFC